LKLNRFTKYPKLKTDEHFTSVAKESVAKPHAFSFPGSMRSWIRSTKPGQQASGMVSSLQPSS
jgi:hypothetical protein